MLINVVVIVVASGLCGGSLKVKPATGVPNRRSPISSSSLP
jgi:hypothetical protein